jgi:hypothetical protein
VNVRAGKGIFVRKYPECQRGVSFCLASRSEICNDNDVSPVVAVRTVRLARAVRGHVRKL